VLPAIGDQYIKATVCAEVGALLEGLHSIESDTPEFSVSRAEQNQASVAKARFGIAAAITSEGKCPCVGQHCTVVVRY
jgi:hypothetical protein